MGHGDVAENDAVDTYELSPMQQGMLVHALSSPGPGSISNRSSSRCTKTSEYLLNGPCTTSRCHDVPARGSAGDVDERDRRFWRGPNRRPRWPTARPRARRGRKKIRRAPPRRPPPRFRPVLCAPARLFVARFPDGTDRVIWTFHHLLWRWPPYIVLREWFAIYDAAQRGEPPDPAADPWPYREYLEWRRSRPRPAETFWRAELGTFSRAPTPFGVDTQITLGPGDEKFGAARQRLSRAQSDQLREGGRAGRHGQHAGAGRVGLPAASLQRRIRRRVRRDPHRTVDGMADVEARVGLFINTLPVRIAVDDDADR